LRGFGIVFDGFDQGVARIDVDACVFIACPGNSGLLANFKSRALVLTAQRGKTRANMVKITIPRRFAMLQNKGG